ncbi:MAG: DUF2934 domain-containing protein [Acidobacteria bacterium]|nr:DUF2934 domain-containing protein [Acidobacteriota bacterium]
MANSKKRNPPRARSSSERASLPAAFDDPTREEIEQRAYEIYLARGGELGHDLEDWVEAERELRERRAGTRSG